MYRATLPSSSGRSHLFLDKRCKGAFSKPKPTNAGRTGAHVRVVSKQAAQRCRDQFPLAGNRFSSQEAEQRVVNAGAGKDRKVNFTGDEKVLGERREQRQRAPRHRSGRSGVLQSLWNMTTT